MKKKIKNLLPLNSSADFRISICEVVTVSKTCMSPEKIHSGFKLSDIFYCFGLLKW